MNNNSWFGCFLGGDIEKPNMSSSSCSSNDTHTKKQNNKN